MCYSLILGDPRTSKMEEREAEEDTLYGLNFDIFFNKINFKIEQFSIKKDKFVTDLRKCEIKTIKGE